MLATAGLAVQSTNTELKIFIDNISSRNRSGVETNVDAANCSL